MAKKYIGIDFDSDALRVVTAAAAKGGPILTSAREYPLGAEEDALSDALAEALSEVTFGDRVVACLPAVGSFFRHLEFPFSDPKKLESVLPLELDSQVPTTDELVFDFLAPQPKGEKFEVPAAAVRKDRAAQMAAHFEAAGQSLQILDLAPFAYAAGLRDLLQTGILATVTKSEVSLARIENGRVLDFRSLPLGAAVAPQKIAATIRREYLMLAKADSDGSPTLHLIGPGVSDFLLAALGEAGIETRIPPLAIDGHSLAPAMLPAAALALRAGLPSRERQFDFLKGDLKPKSEWAGFRRQVIAASVLLGLVLILGGVGAYANYAHLHSRAEALREEMTQVYRQTFPNASVIVDVPAQMKSSLAQLQEKARLLGIGQDRSALNLLREVSARTPAEMTLDVRELTYNGEQLRIDGITTSFESINRLSQSLEASPLFGEAQIADAKMSIDGSKVDFRLNLKISPEELAP